MRRRPGLRVVSAELLLKQFGGEDGWASYQPPAGKALFRCPTCGRYGWARRRPMCTGTRTSPHESELAAPAPESEASRVNPADLPVYE